jgi:hypothetical protein
MVNIYRTFIAAAGFSQKVRQIGPGSFCSHKGIKVQTVIAPFSSTVCRHFLFYTRTAPRIVFWSSISFFASRIEIA